MTGRGRPRPPIDWAAVRTRLRDAQAVATAGHSTERGRAIMAERARRLAQPAADAPPAGALLHVLTFALGPERYAIETAVVREVVRLADVTPVPGAPDFVAGITNHRGQVLCAVDLGALFGAPAAALVDRSRLVVIGADAAELGILAERADEILALRVDDLVPPTATLPAAARAQLRGTTRDALLVLDGLALLRDSRLFVDQGDTGAR
jgi:purine-binding chemotaxis protein CheW